MRKPALVIGVALLALLATGCYKAFDFDADGKADPVYFQLGQNSWYQVAGGHTTPLFTEDQTFPVVPVAGDYDANGRWEAAVVTHIGHSYASPYSPIWHTHGPAGDISFPPPASPIGFESNPNYQILPVPAAYTGHATIPAWYRDFDGMWFIQGRDPVQFGSGPTTTTPVPPCCPTNANFALRQDQDIPVPADYDGDGKADLAVYRPGTGVWQILSSKTGTVSTKTLGGPGWLPVPADYDGTGRAQAAVFHFQGTTAVGTWHVDGHDAVAYGSGSDLFPAPGDYDGDGHADLAYVEHFGQQTAATPGLWHISTMALPITLSGAGSPTSVPVETPTVLMLEDARLTLFYRNSCQPSSGAPFVC